MKYLKPLHAACERLFCFIAIPRLRIKIWKQKFSKSWHEGNKFVGFSFHVSYITLQKLQHNTDIQAQMKFIKILQQNQFKISKIM